MAQQLRFVDDIDSALAADETVHFELDGHRYAIDLSHENAIRLRDEFQPWINAARRIGGRARRRSPSSTPPTLAALAAKRRAAIRTWAWRNGYGVAIRGRIPRTVVQAYDAAHDN